VRIPNPSQSKHDQILKSVQRRKLGREAQMLRWMGCESFAKIPVPRVLQNAHDSALPFLVTSKCEGELLINHFGKLPLDAQVSHTASLILCVGELRHGVLAF
jgi:aminoglycoside phosphotransferase